MTTVSRPFKYADLKVEDYSDKDVVVRGRDAQALKKYIREFGKWKFMISGGPGWVIPRTKRGYFIDRIQEVTKPKKLKTIKNMDHWKLRRYSVDKNSGLYVCRGYDICLESGFYEEKKCKSLTNSPCGVCPEHHNFYGKDHKNDECIHRTGVWNTYEKDGKIWDSCY